MRVYFKPWSSLTALSVLLSLACTGSDSPDGPSALESVRQTVTELTVMVDGQATAHDKLRAELNGQPASVDEVLFLLGSTSVVSSQVFVDVNGRTLQVAGASSTLFTRELRFQGLRQTLDTASSTVDTCSPFSVRGSLVRMCVHLPPTYGKKQEAPAVKDARAKAEQMLVLMDDLSKRYPNPDTVDQTIFVQKEAVVLEKIATLYCQASGLPVPCDPELASGGMAGNDKMQLATNWWKWVVLHWKRVGVIPNTPSCPSNYPFVEIYHDDEDDDNANSQSGWLGGIAHDANTRFRFCKVPGTYFRQLDATGAQYSYSVLKFGLFCPGGTARTVKRYFDNEDDDNSNSVTGNIFPNVNILGRNQLMVFCVMEDGPYWPQITGFTDLGFSYGVFAPTNMPSPYALQSGYLYKDDEDDWNVNDWLPLPSPPPPPGMAGSSNTEMRTVRVQ